jgi:hypothetical protein
MNLIVLAGGLGKKLVESSANALFYQDQRQVNA